jgi:hypothetical protein
MSRVLSRTMFTRYFVCHSRVVYTSSRHSRVSRAAFVYHVGRAASARDNKLFLLIITHVNNVNMLGHVF